MHPSFKSQPDGALAKFHETGYFIEPLVFSAAECDQIIKAGMELPGIKSGDRRPAMHPHRQSAIFLGVLRDARIVNIMRLLLGGKPNGLQTEFFYGTPGVKGFSKHQDNFFVEAPADAFASAWIALVDVTPQKGCLVGYPGSHNEGRLPVHKLELGPIAGQDPNANNEESVLPAGYQELDLPVAKGSIVFLHSHFVHGSRANVTNDFRYALLCTYIREGSHFRPGQYAKREAVAL